MGRCQYCDRAISNAYNLLRHQQDFHLDELPEGCEQCDRRFVNKEQKTRHMRQAHKLSCEVPGCLMKFPTEDKLNIHRAREHGGAGLVGGAGAGGARRQQQQQVQKAGGVATQPPQEMTAAQLLMQLPSYSNRAIPTFSAEMKRRSSAASNGFSGQRLRQEIEATADNNNDDDVYDNDEDDNGVEDEEDDPAASTAMVPSAKRARGTGATGRGRGARRTNGGKNMSNYYNNNNNNNNNNGHVVPSMPVAAVAGLGGSLGGLGAAGASNSNSNGHSNGNGVATEDFPLEDLLADGLDDWTLIGELDMAMVEDFKVNRALFRCNVQGCNQEFTDLSDRDFHISSHYTLCPFCLAFLPISEVPGEPHRCLEA